MHAQSVQSHKFIMFRVFCLLLLSAASCTVIYNKESPHPWSGDVHESTVDGDETDDNSVIYTLHFPASSATNLGNINIISNFPELVELYIDNYTLTDIPLMANLPKLKKLSLAKNKLRHINNGSISTTSLEVVNFSGNRIDKIYNNAFGSTHEIYLSCNELAEFSPKWFINPKTTQILHLGGNKITKLQSGAFADFSNLRRLELQNNGLTTLHDNSLAGVKGLDWLHLGHNKLKDIRMEVIGCYDNVIKISYLDVQYNLLNYFRESLMRRLDVEVIRIWGNPWKCRCRRRIVDWWHGNYNTTDFAVVESAPCFGGPDSECVEEYDESTSEEFVKRFKYNKAKFC